MVDGRFDLRIHRKLSLISGITYPMPENYERRSKWFKFFWKMYVYLPCGLMIVELLSQLIQIGHSIENVEGLTTCILSTVYVVQFLSKMAIFRRNEKTFRFVFDEMLAISDSLSKNPAGDENYVRFYDGYYSRVKTVGIWKGAFQLGSNLSLNVLFCILSWAGSQRKITAAFSWTPYDSTKNPGYTVTCLFEMICYGSVTARSGVLDLLFWMMIMVPAAQLNYLRYLLEIIFAEADERIDSNRDDSDEIISSRFDWWLKQHQRILGNVLRFESLASPFLGVNYLASLINLFMSGFVAISSSHWDILQRILINAIIITDAIQLYVISLAGDLLRESSERVADLGLRGVLLRGKKSTRQNFLFALTRTQRSTQFRFGGVNSLSSQTFSKLIQLTMSYFVTILQLRKANLKSNP